MDKKYYTIIAILFTIGILGALWWSGPAITGYSVYKIKSNTPNLSISKQLVNADIDTQESNYSYVDILTIDSYDNIKALVNNYTYKVDNETDNCVNYTEDCKIEYFWGSGSGFGYDFGMLIPFINGEIHQFRKGENNITIFIFCKRWSCPQTISTLIEITPAKE